MDIVIVGDARTGKSTLIQFLAQIPLKVENKMSVYCPSSAYGEDQVSLTLTTTHGALTVNCFVATQSPLDRHFDAALVLFDSNNACTVTNLAYWIQAVHNANSEAPLALADTRQETASTNDLDDPEEHPSAEQTASTKEHDDPPAEHSRTEQNEPPAEQHDFHLEVTDLQQLFKEFHQTPQIQAIVKLAKLHLNCDQLELDQTVPIDVVIVLPKTSSVKCNRIRKQQKCYFYPHNVVAIGQSNTQKAIKDKKTGLVHWLSNWWK